jgi:diguanylate cyclase (GGDEF)-like protein
MKKDAEKELKALKQEFLEMEQRHLEERECLFEVIGVFGTIVAEQEVFSEDAEAIKTLSRPDLPLSMEATQDSVRRLKDKVMSLEQGPSQTGMEQVSRLKAGLMEACRILRRVTVALGEDFYPLTRDLISRTNDIRLECGEQIIDLGMEAPGKALLGYIDDLKHKISEDFRYINNTFLTLLDHVKDLEKTFNKEFGATERLKEIEYFEMKVNKEVGTIANSFNLYSTIDEIKKVVLSKIDHIRRAVSVKKKEELRRAQIVADTMNALKSKVREVEQGALEISKKAEAFQAAAMQDGLTNLYNRKAFDSKLLESLAALHGERKAFSVILFDLDRFKAINDTFGHVAGDKVLQKVAECLKETFRKDDFIARYGGDEFVVIIDGLTKEMARERLINFRRNLRKRRFTSHTKGDIDISVSAGIALASENDTPESVLEKADRAMYTSKKK